MSLEQRLRLWLLSSSLEPHRVSYLFAHCSLRNGSENKLFNSVNEILIPLEKESIFCYLKRFRTLTRSSQLLCKSKNGSQPRQNYVFDMSWKLLSWIKEKAARGIILGHRSHQPCLLPLRWTKFYCKSNVVLFVFYNRYIVTCIGTS